MRVLVVGSGGREHALARGLATSPRVEKLFCAPGNAGTAMHAENVAIKADDTSGLVGWAQQQRIDLTVVGPEAPLCAGIVDRFRAAGLRVFGPSAAAARIEGDKAWAKKLMKQANVPTAEGRSYDSYRQARDYVATRDTGVVVKAAGLAAGKGVFVCPDPADALIALENIMVHGAFGEAGRTVVVEELLKGEELSVIALVSGRTIYMLEAAQDHKRLLDGDEGPNTGGMGAYSPAPIATESVLREVERDVFVPIVDALIHDEAAFSGALYAGLMLTPAGPKVLEFNCRFGDPEAQALVARFRGDLAETLVAVVEDRLEEAAIAWDPRPSVCVVLASRGYPDKYETGAVIDGLERAEAMPDVTVYHAGTRLEEGRVVTAGGRVLGVTALGDSIPDARRKAYEAVGAIRFEGMHFRKDIADRAIR